ncbi:MAG: ATP-binding protein [Betaproteobacteria bacterium]|nr:ATP-binding protein [Betaproteobacteria bacterium]
MFPPSEWTERDLQNLIEDQVSESLTLDYKASYALQRTDGKKAELSKDVSAFSNSAGGLLIYGVVENGHVPTHLDDGFDPNEISKEWIEHVLNSRISRRIDGLKIHPVPLTRHRPGRLAYVVAVPASPRAPHMASDHRFYKRFNFESVPMEEYEVRDVSRRLVEPDVHMCGTLLNDIASDGTATGVTFDLYVENLNPTAAMFALITFHITASSSPSVGGPDLAAESVIRFQGESLAVRSYKMEWRGSARLPLMQGARFNIGRVSVTAPTSEAASYLFWEVLASGSEPKRGAYRIARINEAPTIEIVAEPWEALAPVIWRV